jgi:hypothetical protein
MGFSSYAQLAGDEDTDADFEWNKRALHECVVQMTTRIAQYPVLAKL